MLTADRISIFFGFNNYLEVSSDNKSSSFVNVTIFSRNIHTPSAVGNLTQLGEW